MICHFLSIVESRFSKKYYSKLICRFFDFLLGNYDWTIPNFTFVKINGNRNKYGASVMSTQYLTYDLSISSRITILSKYVVMKIPETIIAQKDTSFCVVFSIINKESNKRLYHVGNTFQKYCFYLRINISKLNRSNITIKDSTFQLDMFSIAYVCAIWKINWHYKNYLS